VHLSAGFPVEAKLADQIKRAGDENGVFGGSLGERVLEGALRVGDDGKMGGVVAGDFRELRCRNGARCARCGEDDFGNVGEEKAGYFVDGFVAKSGVNQPDFARREILLQEMSNFAGGAGVVRTIEINIWIGLQFFETAGPHGLSDTACDSLIGNLKAAALEKTSGSNRI